jgi:hypothetical protein
MRSSWLGALLMCGVVGCGSKPLPHPQNDMSTEHRLDMTGAGDDMMVPDLGPTDMAIPDDAIKPVLYSQFAIDYATAFCARLAACGQVDNTPAALAGCREANAFHVAIDYDAEIMAGHVVINELQCLDAVSKMRCDFEDLTFVSDQCVSFVWKPLQHVGQSCIASTECVDSYCQLPKTDAGGNNYQVAGCLGTCQPFKTTTCDTFDSCNLAVAQCDPGTFTCAPFAGNGQDCSNNYCQSGLYCATADTKCHTPTTQTMAGGACDPAQSQDSDTPSCAPGMFCQYGASKQLAGSTCVAKIVSGQACDPTRYAIGADNPCVDGSRCDAHAMTSPKCVPIGVAGDNCDESYDCEATLYCDKATHKCIAKIADGQPCTPPTGINVGTPICLADVAYYPSRCTPANSDAGAFTTCQPWKPVNASCTPGFDDQSCFPAAGTQPTFTSTCTETKNGGGVCTPLCQ